MPVKISCFPSQSMQLENYSAYELGEIADNMALDKRCSLKTVLLVNL